MNVLGVCKYHAFTLSAYMQVYIFSVDFGCFSRHCEGLWEREEQTDFTLFLCLRVTFDILDLP